MFVSLPVLLAPLPTKPLAPALDHKFDQPSCLHVVPHGALDVAGHLGGACRQNRVRLCTVQSSLRKKRAVLSDGEMKVNLFLAVKNTLVPVSRLVGEEGLAALHAEHEQRQSHSSKPVKFSLVCV